MYQGVQLSFIKVASVVHQIYNNYFHNCTIGIDLYAKGLVISNIIENNKKGIKFTTTSSSSGTESNVNFNVIRNNNQSVAFSEDHDRTVDVTYNYWGVPTGPGLTSGELNNIVANASYEPYLTFQRNYIAFVRGCRICEVYSNIVGITPMNWTNSSEIVLKSGKAYELFLIS